MNGAVLVSSLDSLNGEGEKKWGGTLETHKKIAAYWSVYLNKELSVSDVAMMMALLKVVRIEVNPLNLDSYVDCGGYVGIAGDAAIAALEERSEEFDPEDEGCLECASYENCKSYAAAQEFINSMSEEEPELTEEEIAEAKAHLREDIFNLLKEIKGQSADFVKFVERSIKEDAEKKAKKTKKGKSDEVRN